MTTFHKIQTLLKEQKKSQKQLMDYLGLGKTAFTGWKNGNNHSYKKYIDKIAEFFSVSTDYLLGKTDIKNPLPKTEEQIVYSFEGEGSSKQPFDKSKLLSLAELNEAASNLSIEQIKRITDFIKDMNKN